MPFSGSSGVKPQAYSAVSDEAVSRRDPPGYDTTFRATKRYNWKVAAKADNLVSIEGLRTIEAALDDVVAVIRILPDCRTILLRDPGTVRPFDSKDLRPNGSLRDRLRAALRLRRCMRRD